MEHKIYIQDLLNKFNNIEAFIKNNNILQIEKDIVLRKLRKLYEQVLEITPVKDNFAKEEAVITPEIPDEKESVAADSLPAKETEALKTPEDTGTEEFNREDLLVIQEEKEEEEENDEIEKKKKVAQATLFDVGQGSVTISNDARISSRNKKKVQEEGIDAKTVSEKYGKNLKQTVSEKMSHKGNEEDLSSRISLTPIAKLEHGINVNDRIMFIREIFNNNSQKYNDCITEMEKVNGYEEAMEYLKSIAGEIPENSTMKKFKSVILRRFAGQADSHYRG